VDRKRIKHLAQGYIQTGRMPTLGIKSNVTLIPATPLYCTRIDLETLQRSELWDRIPNVLRSLFSEENRHLERKQLPVKHPNFFDPKQRDPLATSNIL
jgi:hypothetical protein